MENTYNLEPVAVGSSTDILSGSAAATGVTRPVNGHVPSEGNYENLSPSAVGAAPIHYDTMWNASTPPRPNTVSQAQAPGPRSASDLERRDSGTTLIENTLYQPSKSTPSGDPLYANAAFHAGSSTTSS